MGRGTRTYTMLQSHVSNERHKNYIYTQRTNMNTLPLLDKIKEDRGF